MRHIRTKWLLRQKISRCLKCPGPASAADPLVLTGAAFAGEEIVVP